MRRKRHIVTDHAVLRYLERVYGVDVDGVRARIGKITDGARAEGAEGLNADGVKYRLSKTGEVITVMGTHGLLSNRALRWLRRRK